MRFVAAGRAASAARRLSAAAEWLAGRSGWRRWLAAFAAGCAAALAMPPLNLVPALFLAFPALVWLLDGARTGRGAFAAGWWFGFGYFLVGLYWVSNALLVDAARFAWLLPVAACGLPALLAAFAGGAAWAARLLPARGAARILAFAAAWALFEWLRGHALTGFPWNLVGYAWTGSTAMLQASAVIGIYGLSLLTVLAAASPAALVPRPGAPPAGRLRAWPAAVAVAMLAALWAGGALRLAGGEAGHVDGVRLRIVQANIPQSLKWDEAQRLAIFRRHLELSAAAGAGAPPTHLIWPETAVPFLLAGEPAALDAVGRAAPAGGAVLTGAPRAERGPDGAPRIWNSLHAVAADGSVVATYDKFHLVPFGEYMPLRDWIGLDKITPGSLDFSAGPGPRTLQVPGLPPVSPLICYEVIFPGAVTAPGERPGWLLNVTNDAWYGISAGPYQHLQIARVRAVEEGLPLVRAANSGISAVVDPYGRIEARLGLGQAGVVDAGLPRPLAPTPYARLGDLWFFALLLSTLAAGAIGGRRAVLST